MGMKSITMLEEAAYDRVLFMASLVIAILVSRLAFWFLFKYRSSTLVKKLLGSAFLGLAISSMHYAGMSAVDFTAHDHGVSSAGYSSSSSVIEFISSLFIVFILLVLLAISARNERYTAKIKESEEKYRRLVELSPIGIAIHRFGVITYMNPAGMKILGVQKPESLVGQNMLTFIHPDYHAIVQERWRTIREENRPVDMLEEQMIRLDKQVIDVEIKGIPIIHDGERFVQIFFKDITDRKRAENLVCRMAYHDPLTGLPNRRLLLDSLNKALQSVPSDVSAVAVMFIDLDGFKRVNDTFGHDVGDLLLVEVAKRLTNSTGRRNLVSRLAGDEFAVLMPSIQQEEAQAVAEKIIEDLNFPFIIEEQKICITPSVGVSFTDKPGEKAEALIKQADTAMYQAKKQGKNNYKVYLGNEVSG